MTRQGERQAEETAEQIDERLTRRRERLAEETAEQRDEKLSRRREMYHRYRDQETAC